MNNKTNQLKIFDLHQDVATSNVALCEYLSNCVAHNLTDLASLYTSFKPHTTISAFWTTRSSFDVLDYISNYIKNYPPACDRLFAIEDLWFVDNENVLEKVCKLPIVYAGLTWNDKNTLAGGANSDVAVGLSDWGKRVVKALSKSNIVIDTAHLNEKSFYDVLDLDLGYKKIINSHCCQNAVYKHNRNLSDNQIALIIEHGGLVGLSPVSFFMKDETDGKSATVADFAHQIDRFVQTFGCDNLAIGTDFYGADPLVGLASYNDFYNLQLQLEKQGYKKIDIAKIFFSNADKFFS